METYRIIVHPDSKKTSVVERNQNRLEIYVKECAQENRANHAAIDALAQWLGIPASKLRIIAGHHRSNKTIEVRS